MMKQRSRAEAYAHMNNAGSLKPGLDDPERSTTTPPGICKLLEQQTNSANPIPAGGEIMGAGPRIGVRQRFTLSFVRSVQQVEDDDAFCRLIYRFTVNR